MPQSPTVTSTGRVIEYGEIVTRGKWSKRTVVIEIEPPGEYKGKYLAVDFGGKRLADSDSFGAGDTITVAAFIGSREYQGRWYHDIAAKSVTVDRRAQRQQESEPEQDDAGPDDAAVGQDTDEQGSMPF
jgi:hypothetical protein